MVLSVLAIGLTLVLGVGTFAALTRPPRPASSPAASASAGDRHPGGMGW